MLGEHFSRLPSYPSAPSWCLHVDCWVQSFYTLQLNCRFFKKTKICSYLRNYVLQPTKYANAALSRDKVLAIPNSCVELAAKWLLIVKHKQALQSILIVILTSGFVIRLDVLFKVTMLTRGKGVGLSLWFWRGCVLWPAKGWYGRSARGFYLSWGPQAVEWRDGLSCFFLLGSWHVEHWWTQHNVEWELFGSWDTGAKLQVRDNTSADLLLHSYQRAFSPPECRKWLMLNTFTFQFSSLLKWSLTDWTFQLPLFFTTSAFYLRNTLQEAGVNLGEETIRWCLIFRGKQKDMAALVLHVDS